MVRYQYLITAPKIEGLSLPMIDRFDIAFGSHFDRWANKLVMTENDQNEVKKQMQKAFPDITDEQINKAFVEFCKSSSSSYEAKYLAPAKHHFKNLTDLENKAAENITPIVFENSKSTVIYPLDEVRITELIAKLQGEPISSVQKEQMDDSLLLDIFSEDELDVYKSGFQSSYRERQNAVKRLKQLMATVDFETTYVYLCVED